jgi:hypothetical protein
MGRNWIPPVQGPRLDVRNVLLSAAAERKRRHVVALQVAFERRILKSVFHLIGYRLWV